MITYGTNPGMGMPVSGTLPDPDRLSEARSHLFEARLPLEAEIASLLDEKEN